MTSQIETHHVDLPSFGSRRYRLYRPPESVDGTPRPLLLLFDGQNVFDDEGSFVGGWFAHEAVERLSKQRRRPFLVGLDHGGDRRISELSPYPTKWGNGHADEFLGGIIHVLLPRLRQQLPIIAGAAGVVLGGSSMGGLASFYGHCRYPQVFGGALAMSPSFWGGAAQLMELVRSSPVTPGSKIYLDCGPREGPQLLEEMGRQLAARGYGAESLCVRVDKRGRHNERSWRRRLPGALRFFFK